MKRTLLIVLAVLVAGAIVALNVRNARGRAIQVDAATVVREDLVATVTGSGRIEARRSVSLTSPVVGKVLELAVAEGDTVKAGDLLLRVDPGERKARVEQSRANLASAKAGERLAAAEREKAHFDLERVNNLLAAGLASDTEVRAVRTAFDVADARFESAQEDVLNAAAALEQARVELDRTVIRSDLDGVVVRLTVEQGENVLAGDLYNSGSAIVVIADLSDMEAWILVDETEVVRLKRGQPAEITVDAFPDRTLTGTVVEVANSAYNAGPLDSQEAKDFRIRIRLDESPERFRPGLSARAEIVTDEREGAVAVPIEALTLRDPEDEEARFERGGKRGRQRPKQDDDRAKSQEVEGVFLVEGDVVRFVAVETGIAGERHFEVLSGLEEGQKIVRGPFDVLRRLSSGEKVKVKKDRSRSAAPSSGEKDDGTDDEPESGGE